MRRGKEPSARQGRRRRLPTDIEEEQVVDMIKKMMENMSEEERVRMMERCFEFLKGKESGQEEEREEKERKESSCFPEMAKMAECCPEMMEAFFLKMKSCFEGMGKEDKKDPEEKTEKPGCCQRN
jgi:hypothetical protein